MNCLILFQQIGFKPHLNGLMHLQGLPPFARSLKSLQNESDYSSRRLLWAPPFLHILLIASSSPSHILLISSSSPSHILLISSLPHHHLLLISSVSPPHLLHIFVLSPHARSSPHFLLIYSSISSYSHIISSDMEFFTDARILSVYNFVSLG